MPLILAAFLAAHGLVHLSFLTPAPPRTADGPEWPFELGRSWLIGRIDLDPGVIRVVGVALVAATVVSFSAAALATIGWLAPSWWAGLVAAGASASLITLALFFRPWLVLGIAIDVILLWVVLAAGWVPLAVHDA